MADQARAWHDDTKGFSTVFWGVIATDQALHLSILAISFYWLAR